MNPDIHYHINEVSDFADDLIRENHRLKAQLYNLNATEDEMDRAETIVALRRDVERWKGQYEFALTVMSQQAKESLT